MARKYPNARPWRDHVPTAASLSPRARAILSEMRDRYTPAQAHALLSERSPATAKTVRQRLAMGWSKEDILRPVFERSDTELRLKTFAILALTIHFLEGSNQEKLEK